MPARSVLECHPHAKLQCARQIASTVRRLPTVTDDVVWVARVVERAATYEVRVRSGSRAAQINSAFAGSVAQCASSCALPLRRHPGANSLLSVYTASRHE